MSRPSLYPFLNHYVATGWAKWVQFSAGAGIFSFRVQTDSGAYSVFCSVGTEGSFLGIKAAGAWGWPHTPMYSTG